MPQEGILVMGNFNFNIPSHRDTLYEAITSKGQSFPKALRKLESGADLAKGKRHDQILHYAHHSENFTNVGGVPDFYQGNSESLFPGPSKDKFT
ncbi:MAG TPA: hypothetical protein PLW81_09960 [Thiobacillaceae bacterium]|nr:hypothetical protein [Thiobacillaceae bacterium]